MNWIVSLGFVVALGCNGGLGGCGCGEEPLPSWDYIPVDQQVEGGGQVRVTPNGFDKLTQLIPPVLNDAVAGIAIPENEIFDAGIAEATLCPGDCPINVNVDSVDMSVPQDDVFNVRVQLDGGSTVKIAYEVFFVISGSCNVDVTITDAVFDLDILFGIAPDDGELTLNLGQIRQLDLTGISLSGCGGIADIVDSALGVLTGILDSFIFDLVEPLLRPLIDDLLQGFLPDPLGLNHKIDAGALVAGLSPGTNATLEFRGVPGGYVALKGGGMSLGLITGINADEDESTRTPDLDSEAALCVPPLPSIDFSAAPHNLPVQPLRNTFSLQAAGEFNGMPDPAAEVAIGMSETTLDLAGHHAVTSGLMCLGIGTSLVEQLNLGLIGILVPSLAELGNEDGSNPLLLVIRPQKALDFTIGEGTEASPALTIHIDQLELDFYAFIYERYVRGFTVGMTMDVGINLEFTTDANGDPAILPTLTGLDTDMIDVTVHNNEFLREDTATLENVLPSIFDLALPLITNGLEPFAIPDFAGFTLTNLQVSKVTTSEDDFLALFATLGSVSSSSKLNDLAARSPALAAKLREMSQNDIRPIPAKTEAKLESVYTPPPAEVRAWLAAHPEGDLPTVTVDVPMHDDMGRELEYTWSIERGIIRPFRKPVDGKLVIRDRAFAFQGHYQIVVQSRVVGDYMTHDREGVELDFVVDSVAPTILVDQIAITDGILRVPATDLVTARENLLYAFGRPGEMEPRSDWSAGVSLEEAAAIATDAKQLKVFVKDELGNTSSANIDLGNVVGFHGAAGESGCNCDSAGGGMSGGTAVLAGLVLLALGLRRPRRALAWFRSSEVTRRVLGFIPYAGAVIAIGALPACSCGGDPGGDLTCEIDEDCIELCPENTIPICFDNQCVCADDVPYGRIGQDSDMDVSSGGAAWVSAYNSSHGDMMIARWPNEGPIPNQEWEFIDGVPDGPVVLETSDIRDGIFDPGPDVGTFTSIAVQPDDTVVASYFDNDTGSLKFAQGTSGNWAIHTVETGMDSGDPEIGATEVGRYTSITVRSDDGRPGIAYLAVTAASGQVTTEVRYAAAQTPTPTSASDWNVWVVDTATTPAPDSENPDFLGIPNGVGLFVESARKSDETPVLVYYDRVNGDLKMAQFDAVAGTFQNPVVLDGADADVGWYPSVTIDENDDVHVTYVSATNDDLYYINTVDSLPEIVDDGYRIVGQTDDGLPKPEFHFVGDDSSVVLSTVGPVIVYQDATTHELLLANKNGQGQWEHETVAGDEEPFEGGYGFYASAKPDGDEVVMSSWVIDQPSNAVFVEIFRRMVVIE
jgi:MYXO-CTERM domain-containing protein